MSIQSWQAVLVPVAISAVAVHAEIPRETWLSPAALSLSAGVAALSLMGLAALLGGRWKLVESPFGGLDRVYTMHKWLGVWALVFASFHFVFKASLKGWDAAAIIELPTSTTRLARQLSFVALMLIVVLALDRNIPYRVWRWWHKLSGPLFLIVILHWLSFKSPLRLDGPAGVWLALTSTLGVAAAAYKLLLYPFLSAHAEYRVVAVEPGVAALGLELEPVGRRVQFEAGQFAFLQLKQDGLREPHPFTIASGGGSSVHFLIRSLGDYTQKLMKEVAVGMHADIYAPYGRFERAPGQCEVWIGGGVGISPFLAWLTDDTAGGFDKVALFYFSTPGRDFPSAAQVRELAQRRGAELVPISGGERRAQLVERLGEIARRAGPAQVQISFCGPKGLLREVRTAMREHGIPAGNLRFELFEFR